MLLIARVTGEDLRQSLEIEQSGSLKHSARNLFHIIVQAVAHEAECEGAMFHRPNRAAVIAERIVGRMARRQGANAPAREHVFCHEAVGGPAYQLVIHDAAGNTVSRIGPDRPDLVLLGVESHGEELFVLHPEHIVEALFQLFGLLKKMA